MSNPLQNFVNQVTVVGATWLNQVDVFINTLFNSATTQAQAQTALGVTATGADPAYLKVANNLSDLQNPSTACANLGLAAVATSGSASDLSSGILANARVQQSNVTQWQTALSIAGTQVTGTVPAATTATTATTAASATTAATATALTSATSAAPSYACRAFGQFVYSGSLTQYCQNATVTRNSTGNYSVTFTTPMPNGQYAVMLTGGLASAFVYANIVGSPTADGFQIETATTGGVADINLVTFAVFSL